MDILFSQKKICIICSFTFIMSFQDNHLRINVQFNDKSLKSLIEISGRTQDSCSLVFRWFICSFKIQRNCFAFWKLFQLFSQSSHYHDRSGAHHLAPKKRLIWMKSINPSIFFILAWKRETSFDKTIIFWFLTQFFLNEIYGFCGGVILWDISSSSLISREELEKHNRSQREVVF